jgi:hypothetical protein
MSIFENKNNISEIRQKYYSNPAVGISNLIDQFFIFILNIFRCRESNLSETSRRPTFNRSDAWRSCGWIGLGFEWSSKHGIGN